MPQQSQYIQPIRSSPPSPFTVHRSPFTAHRSPFTAHRSPFTLHLFPAQFPDHAIGAVAAVEGGIGACAAGFQAFLAVAVFEFVAEHSGFLFRMEAAFPAGIIVCQDQSSLQ
jgi:hypothetical protein